MSVQRPAAATGTRQATTTPATPRPPRGDGPVEGWQSLTDTERRVASLVAEGLTNAEVGRRMFLSRHTIDFHLRQVFRKLTVHSRVAMTRCVLEVEAS